MDGEEKHANLVVCIILVNTYFHHLRGGEKSMCFSRVRGKGFKVASIAIYSTVNFKIKNILEVPSIATLNLTLL